MAQRHRQSDRHHKEIPQPHNCRPPHLLVPLRHARAVPIVDRVCRPREGAPVGCSARGRASLYTPGRAVVAHVGA